MNLDTVILVILGLSAFIGALTGLLAQVSGAASLLVAYLFARPVGNVIAQVLTGRYNQPASAAAVTGAVLAGMGLFAAAKIIFWIANRFLGREGNPLKASNRVLGAVVGTAKAVVVIWLVACLLSESSKLKYELPWDLPGYVSRSKIATWMVNTYNPVASLRVATVMRKLRLISEHPDVANALANRPDVAAFLGKLRDTVATRLGDTASAAARAGDPAAIVKAARLRDFINNDELLDSLLQIDLEKAIEEALKDLPESG